MMAQGSPRSCALAIAELYSRQDLRALIGARERGSVRELLDKPKNAPDLEGYLLEVAVGFAGTDSHAWVLAALRRVIDREGVRYDLASGAPRLVRTAVRGLEEFDAVEHLDSGDPGIRRLGDDRVVASLIGCSARSGLSGNPRNPMSRYSRR